MANVCERCKRSMSSHNDHASCPQCRMAAGECHLDIKNLCNICGGWTSQQWGKLRRSLVYARATASQRGRQHWTAAFPRLEAWILSRPVSASSSGPASEISSQAGGDDFDDNLLVSTPSPLVQQVLVVQAQNGVNMGSGTATTAPSTATTAPSKAPLPLIAGPSTMEPIVPVGAQLGAQDTPSVIQGARPAISTEQTMQSTQRYGTLPYVSGPLYTAPLPYAAMPAMSARPTLPMGHYGQGNQFPLMPNPNWMMTEREQMLQQQLLQERQQFEAWRASQALHLFIGLPSKVGDDVDINVERSASTKRARPENQTTDETKRARSASTSRRSSSPKRDYPRGTCTATRPSQASPKWAEHTLTPAQDLEAFKADMTSMLSDMLQASLSKFASQFNPSSGCQGDSVLAQTVASEPTVDVASNYDDTPQGPGNQSEGEIIDSEGDPVDAGLPILDNLKMSEEEKGDYDAFSLASVSVHVPVSKRPWRAQEDSKVSKPQPQDVSNARQARPQAVAKAQSVKSTQSDQRSVQLRSVQDQPVSQVQFPVLVSQGQGQRQGLGRPVVV